MKLMQRLFAVIYLVGLVTSGFAQTTESQQKTVFGYVDPKTGLFHSLARTPLSAVEKAAITPITGQFVFNVTIAVSSKLSTKAVIGCQVDGGVDDLKSGYFSNEVSVTATRSGNTAKCTLTVPYSWDLATPTTDTVVFDLSVSATLDTVGTQGYYYENFTAPSITSKVPANGATTTQDITTTI